MGLVVVAYVVASGCVGRGLRHPLTPVELQVDPSGAELPTRSVVANLLQHLCQENRVEVMQQMRQQGILSGLKSLQQRAQVAGAGQPPVLDSTQEQLQYILAHFTDPPPDSYAATSMPAERPAPATKPVQSLPSHIGQQSGQRSTPQVNETTHSHSTVLAFAFSGNRTLSIRCRYRQVDRQPGRQAGRLAGEGTAGPEEEGGGGGGGLTVAVRLTDSLGNGPTPLGRRNQSDIMMGDFCMRASMCTALGCSRSIGFRHRLHSGHCQGWVDSEMLHTPLTPSSDPARL